MPSDSRLVRRAASGDRRAFAAIYERYGQELYRFCLAITHDEQDAQDALQNTMVKALRALPGERREIKLKPWLYRIAHNEAVETIRRRRDSEPLESTVAAVGSEVGVAVESRDRLRTLLDDLGELPDRQRAALVMRELGDMGFAEIGAAFGSSPAVARQTVYEARLGLRQMEEGREMSCDRVCLELSNADGRVARRRDLRAHLRGCAECRAFRDSIAERRRDLAALPPLPAVASAGILKAILGSASGAGGAGGLAGSGTVAGTAAGKAAAGSVLAKVVATTAVVAAGVTAADRTGLIDTPIPGGSGGTPAASSSSSGGGSGPGASVHPGASGAARSAEARSVVGAKGSGSAGGGEGTARGGSGRKAAQAEDGPAGGSTGNGQGRGSQAADGHSHGAAEGASESNGRSASHRQSGVHGNSGAHGHSGSHGSSGQPHGNAGGTGSQAGSHGGAHSQAGGRSEGASGGAHVGGAGEAGGRPEEPGHSSSPPAGKPITPDNGDGAPLQPPNENSHQGVEAGAR